MALSLNNTLANEISNSYCDQPFADDYFASHYSTTKTAQWAALTSDQKTRLLIHACRVIETARFTIPVTLPDYAIHYDRRTGRVLDLNLTRQPVKYFYYQRLQFPRNLDVYFQNPPAGSHLGDLYIPEPVLIGQCEQAIYLLNFDESAMANRLQGVTLDKFAAGKGAISVTQEYAVTGSMLAPLAYEELSPYMVRNSKMQRA